MVNKIISMSVWGNNPRYIIGAKRQIELAKKYYPDWRVRLYADNIDPYRGLGADLIEVKESTYGVFWRFRPLFESDDNIVMVRDTDGRITQREAMAINEWLNSHHTFHIFRDHEAHFEFPIIACAFALKGKLPESLRNIMIRFEQGQHFYTSDQIYLRDVVFPVVRENSLIHTMHEGWFADTRKKLKNPYSFCGNGYDEHDMPLYPDTLAACQNFDYKSLPESFKFDEGVMR